MENKGNFKLKMKLISISLRLKKLEYQSLENIFNILNININNIKTKGEIIKLIIDYIQNLDISEIIEFENTLNINIDNTQKKVNNENNAINDDTIQKEENSESEFSSVNNKMNNLTINKYKKNRNYIQMISESNKLLLGQSQNISNDQAEIDSID